MLKKFTTKQLVFITLMATLLLVVNLVIGGALIVVTGIPLMNAVTGGILFGFFLMIMVRTLPKFGTFTLFLLVYAILEIPTPLGGAPGFWPKVPINVITGLVGDILLLTFRYKKWIQYIGFYVLVAVNTFVFVYFLTLFNVPGVNKIVQLLWWILPLYWVLGTVGYFIAEIVLKRLKRNRLYLQIKAG